LFIMVKRRAACKAPLLYRRNSPGEAIVPGVPTFSQEFHVVRRRWPVPEYHQAYDKSSKWLIEHHGDSLLRLGGLRERRKRQ
jgi:hypothetical protein